MLLDTTNLITAQKGNDKAALALSSFIHALFELGSVAVARLVKKDNTEPMLTILSPSVSSDYECLIENALPFAEDIRLYRFPPLDKVLTVSGKNMTEHRNLPPSDLLSAMSDFVDSMSLAPQASDELLAMDDTFSPVLHTVEAAIKHRAVHHDTSLPPKNPLFLSYSQPPPDLLTSAQPALSRLIAAASVKKVPPKVKGRKRYRGEEKPLSGLDVSTLVHTASAKRTKISPDNAIPEFRQLLDQADDEASIKDAAAQFSTILEEQVRSSFGDANYARVVEGLGVMRQEMVELEDPDVYNSALRNLKGKILKEELGGNRKELWWRIRVGKIGLIDKGTSNVSEVSREEADAFLREKD